LWSAGFVGAKKRGRTMRREERGETPDPTILFYCLAGGLSTPNAAIVVSYTKKQPRRRGWGKRRKIARVPVYGHFARGESLINAD
jgi:hypothetical protein